ncbi:hypothetical protein J6590_076874 [Homalodisca vitripennis]|nr:hypothetical protein J6590_076874 [Homalodisca vitripennis]
MWMCCKCGGAVNVEAQLMWRCTECGGAANVMVVYTFHKSTVCSDRETNKQQLRSINYSRPPVTDPKLVVKATERHSVMQTGVSYGISRVVRATSAVHETCA